jgi:hypothetical protein
MTSSLLKAAVLDPILPWIRISKGNLDPDPGKLKGTPQKEKYVFMAGCSLCKAGVLDFESQ